MIVPAGYSDDRGRYDRHKDQARRRQLSISRAGRDIAPLPPIDDPRRRAAAFASLRAFYESYFPLAFALEWSPDHLQVIARFEQIITHGGLVALAMPRGSGKTTMALAACLWALVTGRRRFVVLIAASDGKARQLLKDIKTELESNELLAADFPEICFPIRKLEHIYQRARGQLCNGQPTSMSWTASQIILPTIAGSRASGGILSVSGLTGSNLRGQKHTLDDGTVLRPDLFVADDPQTRQSAKSPDQCQKRMEIISGDVMEMAGPGQTIAGVACVTCIEENDLAARILDRKQFPDWQGELFQALYAWPTRMDLWEEYDSLRRHAFQIGGDGAAAGDFYRRHQVDMDAGARVAWPARRKAGDLSALQSEMDSYFRDPLAYWAEKQNKPKRAGQAADAEELSAEAIGSRLNGLGRGRAPATAHVLTSFIDVHQGLLFYCVCAFDRDSTGYIIDYGSWPEQPRPYFTLADARHTLGRKYGRDSDVAAVITAGLNEITQSTICREWPTEAEGGPVLRIQRGGVDANWGAHTDTVYSFCRASSAAGVLLPCHGRYVGASGKPMSEWNAKPGEIAGFHWRIMPGRRRIRHLLGDVNFWKTTVYARLALSPGTRRGLTFYGRDANAHRMFVDHVKAIYPTRVESRGRVVDEWRMHPGRDDHLMDCLVGCFEMASVQGIDFSPTTVGITGPKKAPRRPVRRRVGQLKT